MELKSRILKFINKDLMTRLNSIARDVLIPDNNTRTDLMLKALDEHNVPYSELGSGTNRLAVFIDGYVFKIGMDKAGIADNWAEFSLAQELQPFVTKCYECNGLIAVSEYVTVISKEEFQNSKEEVRQILSHLADSYLLGDVGSINKNFMNWGYRNDGSLVILDYAYIYRVIGNELICNGINKDDTICDGALEYDQNFHKLICSKCRKTYTFHEIRRKISKEYEEKEKNMIKELAYELTKPSQKVTIDNSTTIMKNIDEGDNDMNKYTFNENDYYEENEKEIEYDEEALYEEAIEFMKNSNISDEQKEPQDEDVITDIELVDEAVEDIMDDGPEVYEDMSDSDDEEDDDDLTLDDITTIIETPTAIEDEVDELEEEIDKESISQLWLNGTSCELQNNSAETIDVIGAVEQEEPQTESTTITIKDSFTPEKETIIKTESNTVELNVDADTVVLTTPDEVENMRAMLNADLENQDDEEYVDEYEELYGDEVGGIEKINRKRHGYK